MDVQSYACTHLWKTEKLYAPGIIWCGGIKTKSKKGHNLAKVQTWPVFYNDISLDANFQ